MAQAAGYSFNSDTVAGSKVRDLAGYFLHGTIVGSAAIATGKTGYGDALNCTGGALQIPVEDDTYPIDASGGLTVAAWVKLNTTTSAARCIASGVSNSGATRDWALYASNGSGNVEFKLEGATHSSSTSIRDSAWHHVMVVVNKVPGPGNETVRIVVDGTQVYSATGLTTGFDYTGSVTVEVGRDGVGATEVLDGLVDDFRWWNDPVGSASWTAIRDAEQVDLQLAIYPFDGTVDDYSVYGRDLTKAASGSFDYAMYGHGLVSTSAAAGASATVDFGNLDRLAITGWMRLDVAPVGSAAPIMAIANTGGTNVFRAVVNTDRTVTLTWVTIYGTISVSSTTALTVGQWTRYHFNLNPTYAGVRLGTNTQVTTSTGNSDPHLTPTVNDLKTLYVGGDATAGGQVSYDYATFTRNFLDVVANTYWTGAPVVAAVKPTNSARLVAEFNENTGTTANDQSASNNDLTLTAAGGWTTGVEGSALSSTGSGGAGARKASGLAWAASPIGWAFSGWFKCRSGSSGARILVLRNSGSEVAHVFYLSGAFQLRLYGASGNTGIVSPNGSAVTAETWTHLAASCNGQTIQFWKNGTHYGHVDYTMGALLSPTELNVGGDTSDDAVADVDSLTLFDTPLSDSQVRWLFENPGEFAASVPVTADRSTTWNVKAAVASTRATTWDTLGSVTATRAASWDTLAEVDADRSTSWDVLDEVTSSRATEWDTLGQITDTRSTTWAADAQVTSTRETTWDTAVAVEATRSTTWGVKQAVTSTRSTTWDVEETGSVTSTRSTTWTTKALVTATRATTWDAASLVTITRIATWDALASLAATRATTWRTRARVSSGRSTQWDVESDAPPEPSDTGLTVSNTPASALVAANQPLGQLEVSNGL